MTAGDIANHDLTPPVRLGPVPARVTGDDRWEHHEVRLVTGRKSNLTFELSRRAGSLIPRRPPTGHLPPRAHDMRREGNVQPALEHTQVPVPIVVLEELEPNLLGVAFYVMEKVPDVVLRDGMRPCLRIEPADRVALADALVDWDLTAPMRQFMDVEVSPAETEWAAYSRENRAQAHPPGMEGLKASARPVAAPPWPRSRLRGLSNGSTRQSPRSPVPAPFMADASIRRGLRRT